VGQTRVDTVYIKVNVSDQIGTTTRATGPHRYLITRTNRLYTEYLRRVGREALLTRAPPLTDGLHADASLLISDRKTVLY